MDDLMLETNRTGKRLESTMSTNAMVSRMASIDKKESISANITSISVGFEYGEREIEEEKHAAMDLGAF